MSNLIQIVKELMNSLLLVIIRNQRYHFIIVLNPATIFHPTDLAMDRLNLPNGAVVFDDEVEGLILILLTSQGDRTHIQNRFGQTHIVLTLRDFSEVFDS